MSHQASEVPARILEIASGARIAYVHSPGDPPTVVFLCGYSSDMGGTKARFLESRCRQRGQAYLRFDYQGHGASSGRFEDGSIGLWSEDARAVISAATRGPLILVGSSMGGWIMLLVALALKQRVAGLVGVAAAPDFSEELIRPSLSAEQRTALKERGAIALPSDYSEEPQTLSLKFLEESRPYLLLHGPIRLDCPVRLIHGLEDPDVPWSTALELAQTLESRDVQLVLVKGGGHRLSEPPELELLDRTLVSLCRDL